VVSDTITLQPNERTVMLYIVSSTYTQYFVDEVEANSAEEAKAIIDSYDLDLLSFDSATFEVTSVEEDK